MTPRAPVLGFNGVSLRFVCIDLEGEWPSMLNSKHASFQEAKVEKMNMFTAINNAMVHAT